MSDILKMECYETQSLCKNAQVSKADITCCEGGGCEMCLGSSRFFMLKQDKTEFVIDLDTVLKCVKLASDCADIPAVPYDWWLSTIESTDLLNTSFAHYAGAHLYQCTYKIDDKNSYNIGSAFENSSHYINAMPWRQWIKDEEQIAHFGLCPACSNPVRLFHVFPLRGEEGCTPHGRHTTHSIDGFPYYDDDGRVNCPLFKGRRK